MNIAVRAAFWLRCSLLLSIAGCVASASAGNRPRTLDNSSNTTTPIKHVIIVIGENRSFDNLYATYKPQDPSQQVWNLLSRNIVTATGAPGSNFAAAAQQQASDTQDDGFLLDPPQTGAFKFLPRPNTTVGAHLFSAAGNPRHPVTFDPGLSAADQALLHDGGIYPLLTFLPDPRFPANLPNGPFPITKYVPYSATTGDPMHRFYQMWQQIDCHAAGVTPANPGGCVADLYPWVATTIGWGPLVNHEPPPLRFTNQSTWQGSVAMGFYNMAQGDVPYFASLAQTYALSDNYHQFQLGGTGPNSISIGTASPLIYSDAGGKPSVPPSSQVEDPSAYPGSNNWYQKEGFALKDAGNTSNAAYSNCSDPTQPGVASIMKLLASLPYKPFNGGNCAPGAYYLLNNQYPAYERNGMLRPDQTYSVGPSTVPTIGDALSHANVTWKWYGEGFSGDGKLYAHYCGICNPFQYSKSIMTSSLKNNIQDLDEFYSDLADGTLPAVSFVKPDDILDGHPGSSLPSLFEAFTKKVVQSVQAQNATWQDTAIFITTDESGGLYDSGYIQPIDFFGDGPRIMLLLVSPYARRGFVDHTYGDHASLLKFIEKNWGIAPLSTTSRDTLPNPLSDASLPYVPTNSPAVGDLTTMFTF